MKITLIMMGFFALVLQGCATTPQMQFRTTDNDPALARLADSARNIQSHWNEYAAIESARQKKSYINNPGDYNVVYTPKLSKMVSLGDNWTGPVEPLVRELAGLSDYTVRVLGTNPPGDVMVNINTEYRRIIDILADAGYQSGSKATIRVLAKDKVIEVEYAPY